MRTRTRSGTTITMAATTNRKTALIRVLPVSVPEITVGVTKFAIIMKVMHYVKYYSEFSFRFGTFHSPFESLFLITL